METPAQRQVTAWADELRSQPQVECPLTHEFAGNFYVRTINAPEGTLFISKIFKTDFPFYVQKGRCSIWAEGIGVIHLKEGDWFHTKAGTRRLVMCHTAVELVTIHAVGQLRDVAEIERLVIFDPKQDGKIDQTEIDELSKAL